MIGAFLGLAVFVRPCFPFRAGQCFLRADGPQFEEQAETILDAFVGRPVDKRKDRDIPQAQVDHAQDDFGQVGTQNFGLGEKRAVKIILLGIQADADAVFHPAAATLALIGTAARHRHDGQGGYPVARVVPGHARQTGVDHVFDPRYGDGCFSHVGGNDDFTARNPLKHLFLLIG